VIAFMKEIVVVRREPEGERAQVPWSRTLGGSRTSGEIAPSCRRRLQQLVESTAMFLLTGDSLAPTSGKPDFRPRLRRDSDM